MNTQRITRKAIAVFSVTVLFAGCTLFKKLAGTDTIDLAEYEVLSMSVDIRKEHKTICPFERIQMAVFVTVKDPDAPAKTIELETWQGAPGTRRSGMLDFDNFAFHSAQGSFDEQGWFTPSGGILASVATEYEVDYVFRKRPDKFSFKMKFKPDYQCVQGLHFGGDPGFPGFPGTMGQNGQSGSNGDEELGGDGTDGSDGAPGADGQDGGDAGRVEAVATFVKTPFYDRLLAVLGIGDGREFFLLAHTNRPIVIEANGGSGGSGGPGGRGGSGGSGKPGSRGGNGGNGGNGGDGANGGDGGEIELVYDSRFPEIRSLIGLSVRGGSTGSAGMGGFGGSGGVNECSQAPSWRVLQRATCRGADGQSGRGGTSGRDGTSSVKPGSVLFYFDEIPGLEVI